jgi:hypothetical protein
MRRGAGLRESGRLYRVWKKSQAAELTEDDADDIPATTSSATLEEAEESSWSEISS